MRPESLLVQVIAVLSRRTPAFQPAAGEPITFADRLAALTRRHDSGQPGSSAPSDALPAGDTEHPAKGPTPSEQSPPSTTQPETTMPDEAAVRSQPPPRPKMLDTIACAVCGTLNDPMSTFCRNCGSWQGAPAPVSVVPATATEVRTVAAPRRRPPPRQLMLGDLICGNCGTSNSPTRKFCSRCGASLAQAEVVTIPWWRRSISRPRARLRIPARPMRGGLKTRVGATPRSKARIVARVVMAVLLIGGILYSTVIPFRGWVNHQYRSTKSFIARSIGPQYTPAPPIKDDFLCSAAAPDHSCDKAIDGLGNTYWLAPASDPQPVLVLRFDHPVDLAKAIIRNGASDHFQANHRARRLHLVFSTGKTSDIDLVDSPDPNLYDINNGQDATSVEIHIVELFPSPTGNGVAISEIRLFEKK